MVVLFVIRIPIFVRYGAGYSCFKMTEQYVLFQVDSGRFSEKLSRRVEMEFASANSWRGKIMALFVDNYFSSLVTVAIKNINSGDRSIYYAKNEAGEIILAKSPHKNYDDYLESLGYGKI